MAEVITETILPGTYIQVNAEGLLTVGALATGNVGLIGTAEMGTDAVEILSDYGGASALYGTPGDWDPSAPADNIALVRTLKVLFDNGATTIYARRVMATADDPTNGVSAAKPAAYTLQTESGATGLTLQATTPGSGGNRIQIQVEPADGNDHVTDELVARSDGTFTLSAQQVLVPAGADPAASLGTIKVSAHGVLTRYSLTTAAAGAGTAQLNPTSHTFALAVAPAGDAQVRATYQVPKTALRKVTLRFGNLKQSYITPSMSYLAQQLAAAPAPLVQVVSQSADGPPKAMARLESFSGGTNGTVNIGHFQAALDDLVNQPVQILVVAGRTFSHIKASVLAHLEQTENLGLERIAVVGADASQITQVLANAGDVADKRLVLVAPGLQQQDPVSGQTLDLPPMYSAAAVAGKMASLAPHISLTNKTLDGIDALDADYNYGDLKALVQNRVLALQDKRGIRVVKGITTDDGAFQQITLRRIVDFAKAGTRQGANQYIGKLNNTRVRENLRTTLHSFLSDMVANELLTGYDLTVSADRAMEIRGEVLVTMNLNPTFSIDVIRVVMNLS
jgi:hypothetical protein